MEVCKKVTKQKNLPTLHSMIKQRLNKELSAILSKVYLTFNSFRLNEVSKMTDTHSHPKQISSILQLHDSSALPIFHLGIILPVHVKLSINMMR